MSQYFGKFTNSAVSCTVLGVPGFIYILCIYNVLVYLFFRMIQKIIAKEYINCWNASKSISYHHEKSIFYSLIYK